MSNKKLKFDLTVDSSALLCPNAEQFYNTAYISSPSLPNNFRMLPDVKYKEDIANVAFTQVLTASTCTWAASPQTLATVEVAVKAVSAMQEMCRFTLETTFLSKQMAKGSNGDFTVASFMNYYWQEISNKISAEIESIRWVGDTDTTGTASGSTYTGNNSYRTLVDGYEKLLAANASVIDVTATTITSSNVVAEITKVVNAIPAALKGRTKELRIYMSPTIALQYKIATASQNTVNYITSPLNLSFLDIPIVECPGMTSTKMVTTLPSNLVYAFDGIDDLAQLETIDLSKSVATPVLRTRVDLKLGFQILNPAEIVYYGA